MKIFLYETRKLLNLKMLAVMLLAVLVNIALIYVSELESYSPSAYNSVWEKISVFSEEEKSNYLNDKLNSLKAMFSAENAASAKLEFTDNFYAEQLLLSDILTEIEQCKTYADYLNSVDENAENMKKVLFFSDENSFNYRNIEKTERDFSYLPRASLASDKSKGVLLATKFGITDIFQLMMTVLVTLILVLRERELQQLSILKTTKNGGFKLAVSKFSAVCFGGIVTALLLYGSSFFAGAFLYGFGDITRPVQSVFGFFGSNLEISVGAFLVAFIGVKLMLSLVASSVCFLFSAIPVGSVVSLALTSGFVGIETALYFLIKPTSYFAPLRQVNLIAASDTAALLGKYLNINVFGFPANALAVSFVTACITALLCSFFGVFTFVKTGEAKCVRGARKHSFGYHTNLFRHELYKLFISGKALLILLATAAILLLTYRQENVSYSSRADFFYCNYIKQLSGKVTQEKLDFIDNELELALNDFSVDNTEKITALTDLQAHSDYLTANGGEFVFDGGYKLLAGNDKRYDCISASLRALIMVLIAAFAYAEEYRTGAFQLLKQCQNGRGKVFICKFFSCFFAALILTVLFDGTRLVSVFSGWGTAQLFAPSCSIEALQAFGQMPIAGYLALLVLGRFVGLLLLTFGTFALCSRIKSYSLTATAGTVVFAVPTLFPLLGISTMNYFLINPLLIGNVIL